VVRRDEIRTRPCVVLNTSESKPIAAMPHSARVKLGVHLFSQVDDTPAESHALWAGLLVSALSGKAGNWRRPKSKPWETSAEKSPSLRRTRLPSGSGVLAHRRDWMARGADPVHAARPLGAIPALPATTERGEGGLESDRNRHSFASRTVGCPSRTLANFGNSTPVITALSLLVVGQSQCN
jgi:hypothetical protein